MEQTIKLNKKYIIKSQENIKVVAHAFNNLNVIYKL